jgi:hypothetical protein
MDLARDPAAETEAKWPIWGEPSPTVRFPFCFAL